MYELYIYTTNAFHFAFRNFCNTCFERTKESTLNILGVFDVPTHKRNIKYPFDFFLSLRNLSVGDDKSLIPLDINYFYNTNIFFSCFFIFISYGTEK